MLSTKCSLESWFTWPQNCLLASTYFVGFYFIIFSSWLICFSCSMVQFETNRWIRLYSSKAINTSSLRQCWGKGCWKSLKTGSLFSRDRSWFSKLVSETKFWGVVMTQSCKPVEVLGSNPKMKLETGPNPNLISSKNRPEKVRKLGLLFKCLLTMHVTTSTSFK